MKFGNSMTTVMLTTALLLLVALIVPTNHTAQGQAGKAPMDLNRTTLFLAEGMEITPMDPDPTDEYQAVTIPNGFIKDGFRGYNLLPVGHTYWKSVGTWYTPPLKKEIYLGGRAELNFWAYKEGTESSPTSDFRFEIMRGNEVLLDLYVGGIRITGGQDTKITATGSFPAANDTSIEPGTSLSVRVTARCNGGGAVLKYGTKTYPSGVSLGSNSLQIHQTMITTKEIVVEYKDAFLVPWTKIFTQVSIDRHIVPNERMSSIFNSMNMTRELHWEHDNPPGEYEMFVTIGYNEEQNISRQDLLKIVEHKEKWLSFKNVGKMVQNNMAMFVLIILILASVLMYAKHRSKVWDRRINKLPPELRKKSRKEQKQFWKSKREKKMEEWERSREKKVIRKYYEDDDDFHIFRRKADRPRGPADRVIPQERESVGDIEL